jgi:hypothetical protein
VEYWIQECAVIEKEELKRAVARAGGGAAGVAKPVD